MTRWGERMIWFLLLATLVLDVIGYHWHKDTMAQLQAEMTHTSALLGAALEQTEKIPECFCVEPGPVKKAEKTYRKEGFVSSPKE